MVLDVEKWVEKEARHRCVRSLCDLLVLMAVKDRAMSGYDLMTYIYDRFEVLLSPGTVYPLLSSMEREGLIEGVQRSRKKVYRLTKKGELLGRLLSAEYVKFHSKLQILTDLYNQHRPL